MKKLRVLVLTHPQSVPPDDLSKLTENERMELRTDLDVLATLRALEHEVRVLGVADELQPIRDVVNEFAPDIVFNLLEEFHGNTLYDQNVVSFLELLRVPYTGCNPRGLILSREKSLAKKLLIYHRIHVPAFHVFPIGRKMRRPRTLAFPLIVKSLTEHASLGISQASLVNDDEELNERVAFVHRRVGTDAMAEQFIVGREIYVGILGNDRLTAMSPRELVFEKASPDMPLIATARAKHNFAYQQRYGIEQRAADLTTRHGHLVESTIEMDLIRGAAEHLDRTGHPLLVVVGALLRAVHDHQDPHYPLDEASEAAYTVALLVLGIDDPREPS
jgi:D-alanine-D-alanine ligase